MIAINNGGSAFPYEKAGMSLRDYFAAKAMKGILAGSPENMPRDIDLIARTAYVVADAMLKAREVTK